MPDRIVLANVSSTFLKWLERIPNSIFLHNSPSSPSTVLNFAHEPRQQTSTRIRCRLLSLICKLCNLRSVAKSEIFPSIVIYLQPFLRRNFLFNGKQSTWLIQIFHHLRTLYWRKGRISPWANMRRCREDSLKFTKNNEHKKSPFSDEIRLNRYTNGPWASTWVIDCSYEQN